LDTQPDIVDSKGARDIGRSKGEITFKDVSFHYIPESPVLKKSVLRQNQGK